MASFAQIFNPDREAAGEAKIAGVAVMAPSLDPPPPHRAETSRHLLS